jgi:peroxiredoxin
MRRLACLLPAALIAPLALVVASLFRADARPAAAPKSQGSVGRTVKAFSLKGPDGKARALADYKDKKAVVVVFLGTECPVNNQYLPRLAELHKAYAAKGVAFLGVNSNVQDTPTRIAAHVKANDIPFPVVKDSANVVADDFGARRTPEAFVLSPAGKVLYQGRIDDQFGIGFKRKEAGTKELSAALDEVLAGKAVSRPFTDAPGCLIARAIRPKEKGTITYAKHVSRIFQDRCQECHRSGEVGPMPLVSYEDALSWRAMIREVVEERRMPPWHADAKHGQFSNDRSLTKQERETILEWIKQGCVKGDDKDLPKEKTFAKGWTIGKPDVVLTMKQAYKVPAEAGPRGIRYQYFAVPTNFKEDRWVEAAEARPGAREVVHHIIVYVAGAAELRFLGKPRRDGAGARDGIGRGLLVAYAPGDMPLKLRPGEAKKVPKGAVLLFQMHYTPDGVERTDKSSVGLVFAKKPPEVEVKTRGIAQRKINIPAGDGNHEVNSQTTFDREVKLLSFMPHMHLRGKDFKYVAVYPGGKKETLLSVPKYDFNWQSSYRLAKPLTLPKGARIECQAHFDNSEDNPNNPDPKKAVRWGDQTWEEMMIGFVDYTVLAEKKEK